MILRPTIGTLVAAFMLGTSYPAFADIKVNDEEVPPNNTPAESLRGYVKVSEDVFFNIPQLFTDLIARQKIGIPENLYLSAVRTIDAIRNAIIKSKIDPLKIDFTIIDSSFRSRTRLRPNAYINKKDVFTTQRYEPLSKNITVNRYFLTSIINTELIRARKTYSTSADGKDISWIPIDLRALTTLAKSYARMAYSKDLQPPQIIGFFDEIHKNMAAFPELKTYTEILVNRVVFGAPVVCTPSELEMEIPPNIKAESNIYWIEFPIAIQNGNLHDIITDLYFVVQAPEEVKTLELMPNTANYTAQYPNKFPNGNYTHVGSVFKQHVYQKLVNASISATGINDNVFWWTLGNRETYSGTHRFIVVMRVPESMKSIGVKYFIAAKSNKHWLAQGNLLSTKLVDISIPLKEDVAEKLSFGTINTSKCKNAQAEEP